MSDPDPSKERAECDREASQKDRDGKTRDDCSEDGGPGYSERSGRKAMLEEDLKWMGCHRLMLQP